MKIQIIAAPHCPLRDRLPSLAAELAAQGHDVAVVGASGQAIRTIPSVVVDGVVLDVETEADLAIERITSAKAPPPPPAPAPSELDVRLRALEVKVGTPTKEDLDAARVALVAEAAPVVEEEIEKVP